VSEISIAVTGVAMITSPLNSGVSSGKTGGAPLTPVPIFENIRVYGDSQRFSVSMGWVWGLKSNPTAPLSYDHADQRFDF